MRLDGHIILATALIGLAASGDVCATCDEEAIRRFPEVRIQLRRWTKRLCRNLKLCRVLGLALVVLLAVAWGRELRRNRFDRIQASLM
jgi:hypothetical protein